MINVLKINCGLIPADQGPEYPEHAGRSEAAVPAGGSRGQHPAAGLHHRQPAISIHVLLF